MDKQGRTQKGIIAIYGILFLIAIIVVLVVVLVPHNADSNKSLQEYTITFDAKGGSEISPITLKEGEALTLPTSSKDGYAFKGWYIDEACANIFSDGTLSKNITVYAKWNKLYTLTFNVNGGNSIDPLIVEEGEAFTLPTATKNDNSFRGWYIDDEFATVFDDKYTTKDVTLFAKWKDDLLYTEGLAFTLNSDGASYSVSGYTGTETFVVIPNIYDGKPVTTVGYCAFFNNSTITGIEFGDNVKVIENGALYGCTALENLYIPRGIESIDYQTMASLLACCTSVASITVESGNPVYHSEGNCLIETASKTLVAGCKSSVIPTDGSVTIIGNSAFVMNTALESIDIPACVTEIRAGAFYGAGLKNVTLHNGIEEISYFAFAECVNLESISIFDNVNIGEGAFYDCVKIKNVTIGINATIDDSAFKDCGAIESVTIGDGLTSIGSGAFYGCKNLTEITIPNSVTSIGSWAFEYCEKLENINIPSGVTAINISTFYKCTALKNITIPESVKIIDKNAFSSCTSLETVTIPGSVTSIENSAFNGCTSLTNVTMQNGVTIIKENVFGGCTSLNSVSIPDSIQNISDNAFNECSSLNYTIEDNACYLGNAGNSYLVLVKVNDTSITSCEVNVNNKIIFGNAFDSCNSLTYTEYENAYYVGTTNNAHYMLIKAKNTDITYCDIHADTAIICANAFKDCKELLSIFIPNSVVTIENSAFENCEKLADVTIGSGVKSIGTKAFAYCKALESIVIPDNVTYLDYGINDGVFSNCSGLKTVTIGDGVTSINRTFRSCTSLESVTFGTGLTTIGEYAFSGCQELKTIAIPNGVTIIGDNAFLNCVKLESVVFPSSVNTIKMGAFIGCNSLTTMTIPSSITMMSSTIFYNCRNLESVVIEGQIESLNSDVFDTCKKLKSVTIPNSVKYISDCVFNHCEALTNITYTGTKAEWNDIIKIDDWDRLDDDETIHCVIHCTDGDIIK